MPFTRASGVSLVKSLPFTKITNLLEKFYNFLVFKFFIPYMMLMHMSFCELYYIKH